MSSTSISKCKRTNQNSNRFCGFLPVLNVCHICVHWGAIMCDSYHWIIASGVLITQHIVLEFSEVLTDDVANQFSWIDYKCFHHISSSLRFHLIWTLHWKKQLTQKLLKVRHIRHREEVTCDARDNGRLGSKALFSSQIALHVWGIQNGGRPSSGQGSLSLCLHTVHSHKKFFLIVWSRMWLIFECDIFYSCFDSWIARFNIATETVSVTINMSSLNPEVSDSPNTRPPMSPAEFSVFSVFKMTKGCVMLKVKRHVSIYLNIFIHLVWVIKLLMRSAYYILSLSLPTVCLFCK